MSIENDFPSDKRTRSKTLTIIFPILAGILALIILGGGSILLTITSIFYLVIIITSVDWNIYYCIKHSVYMKRVKPGRGTTKGLIIVVIPATLSAIATCSYMLPWFNTSHFIEMWYLSAWFGSIAGIFVIISCVYGLFYKQIRLISAIILIYCCFALSIIIPGALASLGIGLGGPVLSTLSSSNTMFQILTATTGAVFHPIAISPLFCIKFNSSESFSEFLGTTTISFTIFQKRANSKIMYVLKSIYRRGVLLWILIAIALQSFWGTLEGSQNILGNGMATYHIGHPSLEYKKTSNLRTIAVCVGPSDRSGIRDDWSDVVDEDIRMAKLAGIEYLRFGCHSHLLNSEYGRDVLTQTVERIHAAGLKVVLLPRGDASWGIEGNRVSTAEFLNTHNLQSLDLSVNFSADWVLPFLEPVITAPMQINETVTIEQWKLMFEAIVYNVHNYPGSNAKIVAGLSSQGKELAAELAQTDIDAIGFDFYPLMVGTVSPFFENMAPAIAGYGGEVWVAEFGCESVAYGEQAQANMISLVMSEASLKLSANGFCVWSLSDLVEDMPSHLGLFRADSSPKPAVEAYKAAANALKA